MREHDEANTDAEDEPRTEQTSESDLAHRGYTELSSHPSHSERKSHA